MKSVHFCFICICCIVIKRVHYMFFQSLVLSWNMCFIWASTWDNATYCICEHKKMCLSANLYDLPDQWIICKYPTASTNLHIISLSLQVFDMNTPVNLTLYWENEVYRGKLDFLISALKIYCRYLLEQPSSNFSSENRHFSSHKKIALQLTSVLS